MSFPYQRRMIALEQTNMVFDRSMPMTNSKKKRKKIVNLEASTRGLEPRIS